MTRELPKPSRPQGMERAGFAGERQRDWNVIEFLEFRVPGGALFSSEKSSELFAPHYRTSVLALRIKEPDGEPRWLKLSKPMSVKPGDRIRVDDCRPSSG